MSTPINLCLAQAIELTSNIIHNINSTHPLIQLLPLSSPDPPTTTFSSPSGVFVLALLNFFAPIPIASGFLVLKPLFLLLSVINSLSHLFSVSNSLTFFCNSSQALFISLVLRSSSASLSFFLSRKRAEAAVFRRRLSSSMA
jgi:hypothetical protein